MSITKARYLFNLVKPVFNDVCAKGQDLCWVCRVCLGLRVVQICAVLKLVASRQEWLSTLVQTAGAGSQTLTRYARVISLPTRERYASYLGRIRTYVCEHTSCQTPFSLSLQRHVIKIYSDLETRTQG